MGRPQKLTKPKEPVRIRERKLKDGSLSLYLDIYQNGIRKYEPLNLYIVPEKTPLDKQLNENARAVAEKTKAERILLVQNNGLQNWSKVKRAYLPLLKWLEEEYEKETGFASATLKGRGFMRKKLTRFLESIGRSNVTLKDFDADLCRGFINFMRSYENDVYKEDKPLISQTCIHHNQAILNGALNRAVRLGLIEFNPMKSLENKEKVSQAEGQREFLTIEEIKQLIAAEYNHKDIKKAFLFGCFTGLRISDVRQLTWSKILVTPDGKTRYVRVIMQKTKKEINIPLSQDALSCLVPREDPEAPIFDIPTATALTMHVVRWIKNAGINKHITFHCSRHTFATMLLTLGTDIYTTSEMLGHASLETTKIYAKIVDEKKVSAVNKLDGLFSL